MPRRLFIASSLSILLVAPGCAGDPEIHDLRASVVRRGESTLSAPFGGDVAGEPAWLSENGRVALLYRLDADTDGNGRIEAEFGFHGEPWADTPRLWAYDLETGTETRYDELLTVDPTGRYAALRLDGRYLLLDASTGALTDLSAWGIGGADDANPCLPPRQLSFDEEGRRIAFLRGTPPRLVVRELGSGTEREVRADSGTLWRGGFGPWPGWVRLDVVQPGDSVAFPRLQTSCVSRAATAFAQSYSFMGWEGPEFHARLVGPDGERVTAPGKATMVGTAAYALDERTLFRLDGEPVPLPQGCEEMMAMDGASTVVLLCGDSAAIIHHPARGRVIRLPASVWAERSQRAAVRGADGRWWAPVLMTVPGSRLADGDPEYRLARLRMDDGRMEVGPRADEFDWGGGNWVLAIGEPETYALNVATGALLSLRAGGGREVQSGGIVLDPRAGTLEMMVPDRAASVVVGPTARVPTRSGCVLEASTEGEGMQRGPWRRRCLADIRAP